MIISAKLLPPPRRGLTAVVFLGALLTLPLGTAQAGEPDYEAVARRLEAAVSAGEVTASQAGAMMGELARIGFTERMEMVAQKRGRVRGKLETVGLKIRAAVQEGRLSPEEGRAKMEAYRGSLRTSAAKARGESPSREEMGRVKEKIWAGVKKGELTEEQAKERWDGYLKRVRGGERPIREGEHASRLDGLFAKLGVGPGRVERMRKYLAEQGLSQEQTEGALGGLLRITFAVKQQGDEFELDPAMREHLREMGLEDEQMEMLVGLARRIAGGGERPPR